MNDSIRFNNNSEAKVTYFSTLKDCAKKTSSYLEEPYVALSGGSTFSAIYPLWIFEKPVVDNTSFFPVDERVVPINNNASNWGSATKLFLGKLGLGTQIKHHPKSVDQYSTLLSSYFSPKDPKFDTIFLGFGDDGHTASLFPNEDYLYDRESFVIKTISPKFPKVRITIAPRMIAEAKNVIVIITGENKKHVVKELINKNGKLPLVAMLSLRSYSHIFIDRSLSY